MTGQYRGALDLAVAAAVTPCFVLGQKGLCRRGKRKKGVEAEQKNIYSPNEELLERLRSFYHGEKVNMGNTMEV